ncbi:Retrovirus-related Pol polyprotein from transposon RE2 [Sesamum angolense]|uniref:Retrovirus-related Pol polyprotein from transposon RE2 n=1 Tax=Sesamum angolense TaxID=2727404 RepID=A0AAE1WVN3_9LAMI|nr:Retrovirus-related Pol polyprotein from transposon RE2 [Sesamum angolense]
MARALLFQSSLPTKFWGESVLTATYLINRLPTPLLHWKSPFEVLHQKPPDYTHLKVFGCLCYASNNSPHKGKFDQRASKCVFLRYSSYKKAYRVMDLDTNTMFDSRDVMFHEITYPFQSTPQKQILSHFRYQLLILILIESPTSTPTPTDSLNSSPTVPVSPNIYPSASSSSCIPDSFSLAHICFVSQCSSMQEPKTYLQANKDARWVAAMQEELQALDRNGTWELTSLPPTKRAIGSWWVFKLKIHPDGSIARYKARLVAKGYNQTEGVDYFDSFSSVAKSVTVRILMSIAAAKSWPLFQLDINNAFLHGHLDEEVYMDPLEGYTTAQPGQDILRDASMLDARPTSISFNLNNEEGALLHCPDRYRRLVGRLLYLGFTRPDLSFPVQQLSQFMQHPRTSHWDAALHVLRYLKGTCTLGLFFPSQSSLHLSAYSDAAWASCPDSRRSITGFCISFGTSLISWKTKKQTMVSRSSAEAEYRSMGSTVCELLWISYLLSDFLIPMQQPISFWCDNRAALHITANPVFHERTKHLDIDCHLVRDQYKRGFILPSHIRGLDQPAISSLRLTIPASLAYCPS